MGEVVGAALIAHVPTIVLPEKIRRELNNGEDSTLPAALEQLRKEVFETLDYDTVVVLDSHWATTVEFVVTAQERRHGLFTSEELPRGMSQRPYDFPGDPELAHLIAAKADQHSTWITAIEDDHLPFARIGVPVVDLIDLDYGYNNVFHHTPQDTIDKLSSKSLQIVGDVVLEAVRLLSK